LFTVMSRLIRAYLKGGSRIELGKKEKRKRRRDFELEEGGEADFLEMGRVEKQVLS